MFLFHFSIFSKKPNSQKGFPSFLNHPMLKKKHISNPSGALFNEKKILIFKGCWRVSQNTHPPIPSINFDLWKGSMAQPQPPCMSWVYHGPENQITTF